MKIISDSVNKTMVAGREFAARLRGGEVILLSGDLGAGKTVFTKGIAEGLGITQTVLSPTFTIMNEYNGRLSLYHFDAYRLANGEEAEAAGLTEFFGDKGGVCVVEWYSNIYGALKFCKTIKVDINYVNENTREIIIE